MKWRPLKPRLPVRYFVSDKRYIIDDEHEGHKFEWVIKLYPSSEKPGPTVGCPECLGRGKYGGGLGSYDDDDNRECWRCHGTGKIVDPNWEGWHPEPPKELIDGLRKVWREYWNKKMNDEFELTPPPPGDPK